MKRLYNKILNEVLSVYDFDSWDDSEQTFKTDIEKNLEQVFIYKAEWKVMQIFDDGTNNGWTRYGRYMDKVYSDGKKLKINTGCIHTVPDKIYKIVIKELNGITDCGCMFLNCTDLISVPLFDTSKCQDFIYMFESCTSLKTVPLLNIQKECRIKGMFEYCESLDEKTKNIWNPDQGGTPQF